MYRNFQVIDCLLFHKVSAYFNGNKNAKQYLLYFLKEIHDCNVVSGFKKNMSLTVDLQGVSENFGMQILNNLRIQ